MIVLRDRIVFDEPSNLNDFILKRISERRKVVAEIAKLHLVKWRNRRRGDDVGHARCFCCTSFPSCDNFRSLPSAVRQNARVERPLNSFFLFQLQIHFIFQFSID